MCSKNHNHIRYSSCYAEWDRQFFVILGHFLPFYPANNPKNQNFEKMKKTPGDNIILQMCSINDNHMKYGSWDMETNGHNFLSFWTIFCPSNPLKTKKIKISKKWKNAWRYHHFMQEYENHDHMLYCSWDMAHDRCNFHFSFWAIFCPFTPLTAQKIKI